MSGWSTEPKLMAFVKSITDQLDEFRKDSNNNWQHALYWIGLHTSLMEEENKNEKHSQEYEPDRNHLEWALTDQKYKERVRRNLKLGLSNAENDLKRHQIDLAYFEAREKELQGS